MRALLSKQEEPSLYRSTGNYSSHVLGSNLPPREKRPPKVHFAFIFLKTRISTNEAHVSSSFTASFHPFSLKFGTNVAQQCGKKTVSGNCYFLPPSRVMSI